MKNFVSKLLPLLFFSTKNLKKDAGLWLANPYVALHEMGRGRGLIFGVVPFGG